MFPIASLCEIELPEVNRLLTLFGHKIGRLQRGNQGARCHALFEADEPVAVATASALIGKTAGGIDWLTVETAVELSRLAASRPALCRVMLRMWREFVFPHLGWQWAVSYQDARLHTGATYRFDGWRRVGFSHSGRDTRSGRAGRDKWLWVWPPTVPVSVPCP